MEPGKYYCYYKPSYLNGFREPQGTELDWPYLQAFESICRDEFTPLGEVINSETYKEELKKSKNLHTKQFSQTFFDQCFKRTFNVEFAFNTDMKEFREKFKYGKDAEKPILFICWPEMFMKEYMTEYQATLRNYDGMFDVFYCSDHDLAKQYFDMEKMPKELPCMFIIDPKGLQPLKSSEGVNKELSLENNNCYTKKYMTWVFNMT